MKLCPWKPGSWKPGGMGCLGGNPEGGPIAQGPWKPGPWDKGLGGPYGILGGFAMGTGWVTGNCLSGPGTIPKGPLWGGPLRGSLLGGTPLGGTIGPIPKFSPSGVGWSIKGLPGACGENVLPCQGTGPLYAGWGGGAGLVWGIPWFLLWVWLTGCPFPRFRQVLFLLPELSKHKLLKIIFNTHIRRFV